MGIFEAHREHPAAPADPAAALIEADQRSCPPEQRALFRYELTRVLQRGYDRVLLLRIARPVPIREAPPGSAAPSLARLALLGAWPYAVTAALGQVEGVRGHLYGSLLALVCTLMLAMAWAGWRYAERSTTPVGDLLCTSPDRDAFITWLDRVQGRYRQLSCSVLGLALGVVAAYVNFHRPGGSDTSSLPLYLPAAWAGFLGGGVLYWVVTAARAPQKLRQARHLRLSWLDPAHTPGIVRLCACYALVSAGLGAGVITIELAGMAIATGRPPVSLRLFLYGFPVFAAVMAFYSGVQPFWTLSRVVRAYQAEAFGTLLTQVSRPPPGLLADPALKDAFETYKNLRALRTLPVRTWAILQYVTGILASLMIFFLQQVLK